MQNKKDLRIWAKNLRKNLDMDLISKQIVQIFINTNYYKNASNIAIYYPYGTEINFKSIFDNNSKNYFLPKISDNNSMTFHLYNGKENLIPNKYGIFEPATEKINPEIIDLIVIPALMADEKGYRLGYGGGYYDRFLSSNSISATKIILLANELFTATLPYNSYDIPANIIITQNGIYKV